MALLRLKAFQLGYTIYYPGMYAKQAKVYPTYLNAISDKSFTVDMLDTVKGLKELEAILESLANG